ncbi:hypothetical protein Tco_1105703 [Tanacetum coccineum]
MIRASGVQILENNLDNLKLTREEDGEFEIVDPQCLLGSEMLVGLDPKIVGSLFKFTNFETLVFLRYILISGLAVVTDFKVGSLSRSTLVDVILVKGHEFPTIVKVRPVCFHLYLISVNTLPVDLMLLGWSSTLFFMLLLVVCEILLFLVLPEGCDLLTLVELFISVEGNTVNTLTEHCSTAASIW